MHYNKLHIILYFFLIGLASNGLFAQSNSFGNTYIHKTGESVIFGAHDFDKGSRGVIPGIVGTDREQANANYGILGFSDVSPGWTGAEDDTHVDGYVKKYGTDGFVFPIGDNGKYRPIATSTGEGTVAAYFQVDPASAVTTDLFGGSFPILPQGGPFPQTQKNNNIVNISPFEYWDIDGDAATKISLSWDIFSDIDNLTNGDINSLSILGWDGEKWVSIPSTFDFVYFDVTKSRPSFSKGLSNLTVGSITSDDTIIPNQYDIYTFGSIASGTIGDFVWEDLNRDGIQDVGEPGLPDIGIELYEYGTDILVQSTTTDANGRYVFTGVPPSTYYLKFFPPSEYAPTLPFQGDSQTENSDLTFDSEIAPFLLDVNENKFGIDGGYYKTGFIGDLVWLDEDRNGIQDEGENGFPQVRVELFKEGEVELLASTLTDNDGIYSFTNLPPENYYIKVIPPLGYGIGPYKASLDDNIDSDINPVDGLSEMMTLISGQEISGIDAAISPECEYTATINIVAPECGSFNGSVEVTIEGTSGPYTYEWNTGSDETQISNLDTGLYTLIITDGDNCLRTFTIPLEYEVACDLVCAEWDFQVFMEGAYNYDDEAMHTRLNQLGYLPGQKPTTFLGKYTEPGQPYFDIPWYYNGEEGMDYESKAISENNKDYAPEMTDWVLVSLRATEFPDSEVCTRAGMLLSDGQIVFDSENENCCFIDPTKEYYVVIEHRNHLIVMSPTSLPIVDGKIAFDFRSNQSYRRLLGSGQKEIAPGVFAMYAGNGEQYLMPESVGDINVNDASAWLIENGEHSSYYRHDFDLNGDANVQDKGIYLQNIGIFSDVPHDRN